ncbi:hypothetical protein FDECE_17838 [Fusarium decemcellulare]|nr:hypothetical protein FDECE_17838 [Fusarium decemcellulare]
MVPLTSRRRDSQSQPHDGPDPGSLGSPAPYRMQRSQTGPAQGRKGRRPAGGFLRKSFSAEDAAAAAAAILDGLEWSEDAGQNGQVHFSTSSSSSLSTVGFCVVCVGLSRAEEVPDAPRLTEHLDH